MKSKHCRDALAYAEQIIAGDVEACELVRLACQRFLDDLDRDDLEFRESAANRVVNFIERLPHTKGAWAVKKLNITLEPWQKFIVVSIFGFYKDDRRKYSEAYIEVPRKNGKSLLAAGIGLYMFLADGEFGAEVFSGASKLDQAMEVWRPMKQIVDRTPDLKQHYDVSVGAQTMFVLSDGSRCEPVVGTPGDGASVHCGIVDEFHQHKTDELFDVFQTGTGSRDNPLILVITTAGKSIESPCYEKRSEVEAILNDRDHGDSVFGIIYTLDKDEDWSDPALLPKANPNWGISKNPHVVLRELEAARRAAGKATIYKTKHLNVWCNAKDAWLNQLVWQRQKKKAKIQDFAGREAWLAVDLASKLDVAAIVALIENGRDHNGRPKFKTFQRFFAPEETENDLYRKFEKRGDLVLTPGSATDYAYIEEAIKELCGLLTVRSVCFDPWQGQMMMQRLLSIGLPAVEFPLQVRTMAAPMQEVEACLEDRRLEHDGNTMMTWMALNTQARIDAKDNPYPTKQGKNQRIDGMVALIMAMGRYMMTADEGNFNDWLSAPLQVQ